MKPNKKLLMSFMALNAAMSSNAGASAISKPLEYERLYNKMVKNLELNRSNSKNHKLLEQVLNKRNKELQELYYDTILRRSLIKKNHNMNNQMTQ